MTANSFVSDLFFYISASCWIILLIPQLIENHKNKDSESLSLGFLWLWLIGDLFYFTGAVFQNLLWSTIWIALMYLINDVTLIGQTLYYRYQKPPIPPTTPTYPTYSPNEASRLLPNEAHRATPPVDVSAHRTEEIPSSSYHSNIQSTPKSYDSKAYVNLGVSLKSLMPLFLINFTILFNFTNPSASPSHLGLLMLNNGSENNDIIWWAQFCGWISTVLYIGAKIPQIHLNYTRKTCQGLSKWLFIISLLANGTFVLSIITYSVEVAHLVKNIPWILGALGPMFLDLVILGQFYYYNKLLGNSDSEECIA